MEAEAKWDANAVLRDGDRLVPCNVQDADSEGQYVWAFPLDKLDHRPKTSLLGTLLSDEIDAKTNLPIAVWCEWQPCLCDEADPLIDGHFCFMDASPEGFPKEISVEEENGRAYPVMIEAEDHEGVMLGQWDGNRRDQETGLPIVQLFTLRALPAED